MLNPSVREAGFGEAADAGCWVAALRFPPPQEGAVRYAKAVEFPPDGATVSLDWPGIEFPDPLEGCPGYETPTGLPITLQVGRLTQLELGTTSLTEDGAEVEHCTFDATSYSNQNQAAREYARWELRSSGAVVMIPRAPMKSGARYAVTISVNQQTYSWSFRSTTSE
jgi:hypothetical protein